MSEDKNRILVFSMSELEDTMKRILTDINHDKLNDEKTKNGTFASKKITHSQAAKAIGISSITLHKWRYDGLIPYYQSKPGGTIFYDIEELENSIKHNPRLTKYNKK